ncbi:MAG: virulence RhuM family protein [Bacteroidaceae bacterium]|nr:virulence RhuM family protein [Bacteroidaceae bacterium]MBR3595212.1 virulence RhuM family protein [Candidatus Saccharibacteria bacterium]MBR6122721.1 virulence RhuM family protein [Candidatus Saccharibacteria bacterium]
MKSDLIKYEVEEGEVVFDIDRDKETIWATQEEIAKLFDVTRASVTRHLKNIFDDGELEEKSICSKNEHMVNGRLYEQKLYNLDAIISVGYRVNSKKATKFRVWATSVLKRYVVNGAAVNERRLKELPEAKLMQLEGALNMVKRLMEKQELAEGEAKGILEVISRYSQATENIKKYDEGEVPVVFTKSGKLRRNLTIGEVRNLAENLREQMGEREEFGELRDEAEFEKFLASLEGDEAGKSVAEKAARLLYYVVKSEPFRAGNWQIGALVFIYFLTINDCQLSESGETKISDRALTAIVLLIAESEKSEEELMTGLVAKLLE